MRRLSELTGLAIRHRYGLTLLVYLAAAALTGLGCVLFMRGFELAAAARLDPARLGAWLALVVPAVFLLSVELIRRVAPFAAGTGIPQAVFAAQHLTPATEEALAPLTSLRTMAVKVLALYAVVWAGASTGREGPTVHVATCLFLGVIVLARRYLGLNLDLRSAIVAGGSAGLAAAFNTPLAGVTFAVEELTVDYFSSIKDFVVISIVVAAVTAKHFTGEYLYFGRLAKPAPVELTSVVFIGIAGGLLGSFFSESLLRGHRVLSGGGRMRTVLLALGLVALAAAAGTNVLGPGNEAAQALLRGDDGKWVVVFPFAKLGATLLTYWSGVAGGVFAPSLSIGAALGTSIGEFLSSPTGSCAMIGMAAFLSGTIQAPITAFVIIFEMTGHHDMLLPIMLGSLIAFMTARALGARHLYKTLAEPYRRLLS
ncbi:MAG: chloride channel protein [Elusimicrobiota bacterium]|nr:chloride channel protein [Elusimicrobiota bacterium]